MLKGGWIAVPRSLTDWQWYTDSNTMRLYLHLILTANYCEKTWRGIKVKRGQRVASYTTLADETGMTIQNIRTAMEHLKSTGEVTHTAHSKYGVYTVINYDTYAQSNSQDSTNSAVNQQSSNSQSTPYGIKIRNKENEDINSDTNMNIFNDGVYLADIPCKADKGRDVSNLEAEVIF